jgi:prepilin-type N-terminal cleavage/methylation domain-containing protein
MTPICPRPPRNRANRAAFTLIEVMVTVAIIAVMAALLTPAVRGLMGVAGPRGGVNSLAATFEQARLAAMQSGQTTFVGFPFGAGDEEAAYSSVIVFRSTTLDEQQDGAGDHVPLTRWIKMPTGVFIEADALSGAEAVGSGALPLLGTEDITSLPVIRFDRFGKLLGTTEPIQVRVGQKAEPQGTFMGGAEQHYQLTVQPLTGRTTVVDRGKGGR